MSKSKVFAALTVSLALLAGCAPNKLDASSEAEDANAQIEADLTEIAAETTAAPIETTIQTTTTEATIPLITIDELPDSYQLPVEPVMQEPELPTGCEITSLTCLLNYLGFPADKVVMADTYLDYVLEGGTNYTFFEKYIGNPHADGYGCYSPVIVKAAEKYLADQNSSMTTVNLSGSSKEELFRVIASGHPIVIWNTVWAQYHDSYLAWTTPDGEEVYWNTYEHCMLLTGYDYNQSIVTVFDPLRGEVQYDMEQFFNVYDDLYQQAMTIY